MTVHLSIIVWLPVAAALLGAFLPRRLAPRVALGGAVLTLAYVVVMLARFDRGTGGLQFVTDETWIAQLGIHYKLGIDGLNLFLVALAALLWVAAVGAANLREWERPQLFYFQLALAESGVLGALTAQDLLLFVGFFDLMLIPFYFLVGIWGGAEPGLARPPSWSSTRWWGRCSCWPERWRRGCWPPHAAATSPSSLSDLQRLPLSRGSQEWIFLTFAAAFLVKMPAFPVHGWMPDGYRNMPAAGAGGLLGRALQGGGLRLPARGAAALPGRRRALPDAHAAHRRWRRSSTAR